jgi:hypothetical protein
LDGAALPENLAPYPTWQIDLQYCQSLNRRTDGIDDGGYKKPLNGRLFELAQISQEDLGFRNKT